MKLNPQTATVFRKAKEATNYAELGQAVPFARLHETLNQVLDKHDRALERAAERKEARQWTPREDERLRLGAKEEWLSVGELAEELERAPSVVEHRLVELGLLNRAEIRIGKGPQKPAASLDSSPPHLAEDERFLGSGDLYDDPEERQGLADGDLYDDPEEREEELA